MPSSARGRRTRERTRRGARAGALTAVAMGFGLMLGMPQAASAHVGIEPVSAAPGATLSFTANVASEPETASTVSLDMALGLTISALVLGALGFAAGAAAFVRTRPAERP